MGSTKEEREKADSLAALGITNQKTKTKATTTATAKKLSFGHDTSRTPRSAHGEQFFIEAADLALSVHEVDLQNPVALLTFFIQ